MAMDVIYAFTTYKVSSVGIYAWYQPPKLFKRLTTSTSVGHVELGIAWRLNFWFWVLVVIMILFMSIWYFYLSYNIELGELNESVSR